MKVYISGAITNNPHYRKQFDEVERMLFNQGHDPINPVKVADALPELTYGEYMEIDIQLLKICEGIYMIDGWEESSGATLEYHYAKVWKKRILHY